MALSPTYPGVYVQEVPSGVRTITGVSTSVAMFIGMTRRGRLSEPTRVLGFMDYVRAFGDDIVDSEMTDQVRQFFLNGGQQAYVLRIAKDAAAAEVALCSEFATDSSAPTVLRLVAKEEGLDGNNLRVEVDYDTPSPESTFNLRVFRLVADGAGGAREEASEVFRDLTMNQAGPLFACDVISQQSALVDAYRGEVFGASAPWDEPTGVFSGYALAGRLFADGNDLKTAIRDAIDQANPSASLEVRHGDVVISVDGGPPVPVQIWRSTIPDAGDDEAAETDTRQALETAINNALTSNSLSGAVVVSLAAGRDESAMRYLQISSKKQGGAVRFSPSRSADIAKTLQLGLAQGGFEVDGHAARRPAPTGLFLPLGEFDAPLKPVPRLTTLAEQSPAAITSYQLTDGLGPHPTNGEPISLGSDEKMYAWGQTPASLENVKKRLGILAARINADALAEREFRWKASVVGHRLCLKPMFGDSNSSAADFVTIPSESEPAYNLGASCSRNVRSYVLGGGGTGVYQAASHPGDPGRKPELSQYDSAFDVVDRKVDLFNLLILPRAKDQADADMANLWGAASVFCAKRRAFLLMDPKRDGWTTADKVEQGIGQLRPGLVKDHAAIYWPRVKVPGNGLERTIDPAGTIAGLMARIDTNRGVWKAPAGIEADLRGVRGVDCPMSDGENGLINPQAVNAIRVFANGIVAWGARTMDGFDNSGNDDYKYVPVRRFALFLEESLYRGLKWVVFEPNDEPLWAQIRLNAGAFMHGLFRQGAFKGQTPKDAYFVKCDKETTTQNDINLGRVNIWVGFAPLKPAEFVILYLQQMAGQIET